MSNGFSQSREIKRTFSYSSLSHFLRNPASAALLPYASFFSDMVVRGWETGIFREHDPVTMDIDDPLDTRPFSSFSSVIPLPYRVLVLTGIGLFCWATNLHLLQILGIDTTRVLQTDGFQYAHLPLSSRPSHAAIVQKHLYSTSYTLLFALFIWTGANWLLFRICTHGNPSFMDYFRFIPAFGIIGVVIASISPVNVLCKRERRLFWL